MNLIRGKWRWLKVGLLVGLVLLLGYIGEITLDKRAQWKAFLELEQEQLATVTADGFVEREFGVDSAIRVEIASVSSYSRYFHEYVSRISGIEAVKAFLAHAPEPKVDNFTLTYSQAFGREQNLGHPVSWCGDRYCDFNSDLVLTFRDDPFPRLNSIYHPSQIEKSGYKFVLSYTLHISSDEKVYLLDISIGSEPRNVWDEIWARILQIPSGYSFEDIYRVDYVTEWAFFREDMQDY